MRMLTRVPMTSQLRALEADWIKECGNSWGQVLMEIAGKAAAEAAFELWQHHKGKVAIFCGRGNNGGDGMVVARYLHLWGVPVAVHIVNNPSKAASAEEFAMSSTEGNTNKALVHKLGICVQLADEEPDLSIHGASLIVDA